MFVLHRTMDNHQHINDLNQISHELPGFGWMYESDSSSSPSLEGGRISRSRKKEDNVPSLEKSLDQQPSNERPEQQNLANSLVPDYASYSSAATTPTTLAYVDVNSRTHWPIPPPNSGSSISIDELAAANPSSYNNVAPLDPTLQAGTDSHGNPRFYSSESFTNSVVQSDRTLLSAGRAAYLDTQPMLHIPPLSSVGLPISQGIAAYHSASSNELPSELSQNQSIDSKTGPSPNFAFAQIDSKEIGGQSEGPKSNTDKVRPTSAGSSKASQIKRCPVCSKKLRRDLTRHMRIHEAVADFACPFPRKQCAHKHGQFNRPYEYKKHLMNYHFTFDDPVAAKNAASLSERLKLSGQCQCGATVRNVSEWIHGHIGEKECALLSSKHE